MNRFYDLPKQWQWTFAILLLIPLLVGFGFWLGLIAENFLWYVLVFVFTPVFQFAATPIMQLTGTYKYLSPMLLVYSPTKEQYRIHNGTSFDYLMVMTRKRKGVLLRNKILEYYLEGLLEIVRMLEAEELPTTVSVRGSSYFFSEYTVKRLGFELEEVTYVDKINMVINYLDLIWMYSLSKGRLTFPNLKNVKAAAISGADLLERKAQLEQIHGYLKQRNKCE